MPPLNWTRMVPFHTRRGEFRNISGTSMVAIDGPTADIKLASGKRREVTQVTISLEGKQGDIHVGGSILQVINSEDDIWIVESGMRNRLHVWRVPEDG